MPLSDESCTVPWVRVERLSESHDREAFSCGRESIDRWFREDASDQVACKLIAVDALDEELGGFYEKAGFVRLGATRLLFTVKAARALICGERVPR